MKYRIIKQLNGDGDSYYLVQYYDSLRLNWITTQKLGGSDYFANFEDKKFTSIKEAKNYIKKTIKREKNLNTPATVVYEEEVE